MSLHHRRDARDSFATGTFCPLKTPIIRQHKHAECSADVDVARQSPARKMSEAARSTNHNVPERAILTPDKKTLKILKNYIHVVYIENKHPEREREKKT